MRKIPFLVGMWLCCGTLMAEVAQDIPDAKSWADSLDRSKLSSLRTPTRVLLLESYKLRKKSKPEIKALEFNNALCDQFTFISCANGTDFTYSLLINKLPKKFKDDVVMRLSGANGIIFNRANGVLFKGTGAKSLLKIQGLEKLSSSSDVRQVLDRLLVTLGYDGVVLDIKGDYLLVGTVDTKLTKPDLQGLLVRDSAATLFIKPQSAKEGAALLSLMGQHGGYAVFKTVIGSSSSTISVGQKVIIEGRSDAQPSVSAVPAEVPKQSDMVTKEQPVSPSEAPPAAAAVKSADSSALENPEKKTEETKDPTPQVVSPAPAK